MICRRRFKSRELAEAWADGLTFVNDSAIDDVDIYESKQVPGEFVVEFRDRDYDDPDEEERIQMWWHAQQSKPSSG